MNDREQKLTQINNAGEIAPQKSKTNSMIHDIGSGIVGIVDLFVLMAVGRPVSTKSEVVVYARKPLSFGIIVIFLFIICAGSWACLAPLYSAAHAQGIVISPIAKQNLQSQHYGKIRSCFVKQGDIVGPNQVLMELEGNDHRARYLSTVDNYMELLAIKNRLTAQRDEVTQILFDNVLVQHSSVPRIKRIIDVQDKLFHEIMEHQKNFHNRYTKKITQAIEKKKTYISKIKAAEEKLRYISEQLDVNKKLEQQGFASKMDSTQLYASKMSCQSELNTVIAESIICDTEIQNLELEKSSQSNQFRENTLKELENTNIRLLDASDKKIIATDALKGLYICSPVQGVVNYINKDSYLTQQTSSHVADITPTGDLVVEIKVPTEYIDYVRVGQSTKVKFLSFKSRTSPIFEGTLIALSPNVAQNPQQFSIYQQNQKPCYTGIVKMDQEKLDKFLKPRDLKLITGMMADIQIVTGKRTLLRYLLDPILDQSFKAFKEK